VKTIPLDGRAGSRLHHLTCIVIKQLKVFDKPMNHYPLTVLMAAGIREFCLISDPAIPPSFENLSDSGSYLGINIDYREQAKSDGIAQVFLIAADSVSADYVTLILGDNIFSGGDDLPWAIPSFKASAYIYDHEEADIARSIKPSHRGELEITDVNLEYLRRNQLSVHRLSRGFAWLDAGTSTALQEASAYIEAIERRQGVKIGCPEEAALVRGFITLEQFQAVVQAMPNCEYRDYLNLVADEFTEPN